jgi:hypothetical protein
MKNNSVNSAKSVDNFTTGLFVESSLPIVTFLLLLLLIA